MISRIIVASAALLLTTVLAGCGSNAESSSSGSWTYTDGRGVTVTADAVPKRIVAQVTVAGGLWDLGIEAVGVFGPLVDGEGDTTVQAGSVEPDEVVDITGTDYGALDLEKLATLNADLLVTIMYLPPALWYISDETAAEASKIVPTVAIDQQDAALIESIENVEQLAEKLGADLDTDKIRADRKAFDAASDRLAAIGDKLGDKKILLASATTDSLYAGDPDNFPDAAYYKSLGLPIIEATAPENNYWEVLSWENADKYPADIVMVDARTGVDSMVSLLKKQPVFAQLPAVKNDAFVPWEAEGSFSFRAYAQIMNDLADELEQQL